MWWYFLTLGYCGVGDIVILLIFYNIALSVLTFFFSYSAFAILFAFFFFFLFRHFWRRQTATKGIHGCVERDGD